jgi:hypothetical protein
MRSTPNRNEVGVMLRRALAFGYAAIDQPSAARVKEAGRLVRRVLAVLDDRLLGGELAELAAAARRLAGILSRAEREQPLA